MDEMTSYYPPPHPPPPPPSVHHHNSHYPYYPPPHPPQQSHGGGPAMANHWYHHQEHQPHQPPFSSYGHGFLPHTSQDDVRTLFIAGLPEDVKAREIYNLFREFPGYQSSQLRNASRNNQAFGFAVFADQQSAVAALQAVNGLVFDLEKNSTLYIDLAKSNSRSKRSRTDDDGRSDFADKKVRGPVAFSRGVPDRGVGSNIHMPGMGNSAYNMNGYPSTQSHGFDDGAINDADSRRLNKAGAFSPQCTSPPCPTLFVANLGPTCSEHELNQVFSRCAGFLKLKMQNKNGAPVAFVDFQDIACSTAALNSLQDTVLYSSVGEGIRLEFAKSRMGMRRKS